MSFVFYVNYHIALSIFKKEKENVLKIGKVSLAKNRIKEIFFANLVEGAKKALALCHSTGSFLFRLVCSVLFAIRESLEIST